MKDPITQEPGDTTRTLQVGLIISIACFLVIVVCSIISHVLMVLR